MQAASDVNSPVSGEVSAINDSLTDESSKVSFYCNVTMFFACPGPWSTNCYAYAVAANWTVSNSCMRCTHVSRLPSWHKVVHSNARNCPAHAV